MQSVQLMGLHTDPAPVANLNIQLKEYWIGPADVRIPQHITSVIALDGYNDCSPSSDGEFEETEQDSDDFTPYTIAEYRNKFAVLNADGFWYWKE